MILTVYSDYHSIMTRLDKNFGQGYSSVACVPEVEQRGLCSFSSYFERIADINGENATCI